MKYLLKIFTSLLVIGLVITNSFTVINFKFCQDDNYFYKIKNDNTVEIIWYRNSDESDSVIIPDFIDGREVTSISNNAFDCKNIKSIILCDTITEIKSNAFYNCQQVESLKWPAGCKGNNSFNNLNNLKLLSISYGQNGFMNDFKNNYQVPWFDSNESIETLIIEDGVRYIGDYSFTLLANLKELHISENLESIGAYCFYNSNIPDLYLPSTLESIKSNGLHNLNSSTIYLNKSISYLANDALSTNNHYVCFDNCYCYEFLMNNAIDAKVLSLDFEYENYEVQLGSYLDLKIDNDSLDFEKISYVSSDQSIATIDQSGIVKCLKKGTCDIYAYYDNGECKTTINVSSDSDIDSIYRCLNHYESYDLKTEMFDSIDFSNSNISYSSSNSKVARVSEDGIVKALRDGRTTITIQQDNKIVSCIIDVGMFVKSISTEKNVVCIKKGSTFNLNATVEPKKAYNSLLTYISDNPDIAVVNNNGKITGLENGACNIAIISNDGSQVSKTIRVSVTTSNIESSREVYVVGVNKKTPLKITTEDSSELVFVSSDKNVAYVDDGYIYGINEGKCYINVYNISNTAYYSVEIAVYDCFEMGADISEWNGRNHNTDTFLDMKNDGIEFVYIRAAYQSNYQDPIFEANYNGAKLAGLNVGAYHYITSSTIKGVTAEAKWMLNVLKGKQFEYPVMVDVEESKYKSLSNEQLTKLIDTYCQILEDNGYVTIVYSYAALLNGYTGERDCWVAQWNVDNPDYYKNEYTIWQYSSSGSLNGIYNRVDLDISFYDYPTYIKTNHLNGY